ncbi:MAG: plasmid pRiA4b ORF-3 family protein [Cyanobacteria bacterium P01_A01_bin.17]
MAVRKSSKKLPVYQLKITLQGLEPLIWRKIQVTSGTTLAQLHSIIQAVMGWDGAHLHVFEVAGTSYGQTELDGLDDLESDQVELRQVISGSTLKFTYTYDFGDNWQHEILVEKVLSYNAEAPYPLCVEGQRACPPEDCGGTWGYTELLEVLKDPKNPEYEDRLEWAGPIDPEAFDLETVNKELNTLDVPG